MERTDEQRAAELQEQLDANREAVAQQRQRSTSSDRPDVDPRQEDVPCRDDCGAMVTVTVLYRLGEDGEYHRGATPPVMCDTCAAKDAELFGAPVGSEPSEPPSEEERELSWLAALGVNTRKHGLATLENFDPTHARRAHELAQLFVDGTCKAGRHQRVSGLYLVGDGKGNGKTHLAVGILREVHRRRPEVPIVFDPADRLITKIQDSYGTGTTDRLIEERARAWLYVLDDLGREKDTTDALRTLCTILDEREGAPTVITSNCTPAQLGARHSEQDLWARVASRLGDGVYRYAGVDGPDRRFKTGAAA